MMRIAPEAGPSAGAGGAGETRHPAPFAMEPAR